jgi:transketolase C-terminal domain/subunit
LAISGRDINCPTIGPIPTEMFRMMKSDERSRIAFENNNTYPGGGDRSSGKFSVPVGGSKTLVK